MDFERDFNKQREQRPEFKKQLADYKTLSNILRDLAAVAGRILFVQPYSLNTKIF